MKRIIFAMLIALPLLVHLSYLRAHPAHPSGIERREDADSPGMMFYRQQLASAYALAESANAFEAFRALSKAIANHNFASLTSEERIKTLSAAGWSAARSDKPVQARDFYREATRLGSGDPDDWYRLARLELRLGAFDRAADSVTHFAEHWPELLPNTAPDMIPQIVRQSESASDARFNLMQALFDANWQLGSVDSAIWYELAIAQIQRGSVDGARQVIRRIDDPESLVRMRSDKRFDEFIDGTAWSSNVVLTAHRQIDEFREWMEAEPEKLEPKVHLSYALLELGLHEDVISLSDTVISTIRDAPLDKTPFADIDQQVWLMNYRAIALRRLGRIDEALQEMEQASRLDEEGQTNVSQALNLGTFYCSLKRPEDAIKAVSYVGELSGYGRLIRLQVQLCSALQQDNQTLADQALCALETNREYGEVLVIEAYLRAGRMDDAAKNFIELLDRPYERGDALQWAQGYIRPTPLPGDADVRMNRDLLLARDDVGDAISRVGRIAYYDYYGISSMD